MRKNSKKYNLSIMFVLGTIIILAMIVQLTFLSMFGTKGAEVASIRKEQKRLILENEVLVSEINKNQSLDRIEKIAKNELGMFYISEIEYITPTNLATSSINE